MKNLWASILFFFVSFSAIGQGNNDTTAKMNWFGDAKLGIFIHWGIYAVDGIDESWSFHNKKVTYPAYMKQLSGFTAENYDPTAWVTAIKSTGARYAVITTKHHDGVALWDTKQAWMKQPGTKKGILIPSSVPALTPARRDVLSPFVYELKKEGIKTGLYYSLIDWSHPNYPGFLKDSSRYKLQEDTARWMQFQGFCHAQIKELSDAYHPDLWWFDGDWEHSAEEWNAPLIRKMITENNPYTIINGRLQRYGDYGTPEQNVPVMRPKEHYWELCMTLNSSWGWQPRDTAYKSGYELITIFADCISNGGNLLLDIGPKADGTIDPKQLDLLKYLGRWNSKHREAIFGTVGGISPRHYYGPSTLSKDSTVLYLFVPAKGSGPLEVKGLKNKVLKAEIVGSKAVPTPRIVGKISWSPVPGILYIDLPTAGLDADMTVVKLTLDGPIKLYTGQGGYE